MSADPSRRFLIAAGTEHYQDGDELKSVPDDLRKMVEFFRRLGYEEQLPEVRHDPTSTALRRALSEWLNRSDRQDSDTAVIYYSGHGDTQASFFYLLTADSKENRYADTALRADYVLEALGENPKVRRVLLIIDACYAGQGAFDAVGVAARMAPYLNLSGDDEGVWVVAAARSRQEAEERMFADAFVEAAGQLQQTTGTLQPYIGMEDLIWRVNAVFQRRGKHQRASWIPVTQAGALAPFIPNPRYEPDATPNVDLETRNRLRRRRAAELAEYWGPKARGVEVAAQVGWYFTGRRAALAELTWWLAEPGADTLLRVLTGDPGSGKSAVLARLVTLADPGLASRLPGDVSDPAAIPPAGSITAALLARGKTASELLRELSVSLDVAPGAGLPAALSEREAFTVVIDALDEASNPPAVIESVIIPLHSAASPGHGPRLLVATRKYPHLLRPLPEPQVVIDLDQDDYHDKADVSGYVAKVLLAVSDPDSPTPYRGHPELAAAVAEQVAAIARHSFLIAQIAARTLARTPRALDPAEVSADRARWRDVDAAFDRDLDRYGDQAHRVRDLLIPLAWAEGSGLPRELWAPLATTLATDENYTEEDITWLIEQAGFYLVETLDGDRSVYRLYHEQFAEHLRAARSPVRAHERITAELLRHVPATPAGRREWLAATPYIRAHLATHARKGLMLDQLANDPGFLLAADPARLLPALATVTSPEAQNSASAFESSRYLLAGRPLGQAAAQLDLAARVHNAGQLVNGISQLPYERPWTIAWGHWARPDRHVLLGRHATEVRAVEVTTVDGIPVAISGSQDGTIQVWDLREGAARSAPLHGHTGEVTALAVSEVDGTAVAISGSDDGTVRLWDLRAGRAIGEPLHGHTGEVTALAVGEVDGAPVAISGSDDGTMQIWELRSTRKTPLPNHPFGVTALAVGEVDGTPVTVSSGGGMVRLWDLKTGAPLRTPLRIGLPAWTPLRRLPRIGPPAVTALAVSEVNGTPMAVGGLSNGKVLMWNLKTGMAHSRYSGWVSALAVGKVDGISVVVRGGLDGTVRLWDLGALWNRPTEAARGAPLRGHTDKVTALALGEVDGTPAAVSGGRDGTVRLWNLRAGTARGAPHGYSTEIAALAVGEVDGTPVAVSGGHDATVRLWDLHSGAAREKPLYPGWVTRHLSLPRNTWLWLPVAVGKVDGPPVAVSSGVGTMRVWDLKTGAPRRWPLRIRLPAALRIRLTGVNALAVSEVDGIPVAVSGGLDGTVRMWDLRKGKAHGTPLSRHSFGITALAVGEVDGTPVAVSGGLDGTVRMWDLRAGAARGTPLSGHTGRITALAVGEVDGTSVAVSGDDSGAISWWTLEGGQYALARLDAPAGVEAIACGGQEGWIVATKDGSLFLWRPASISWHAPHKTTTSIAQIARHTSTAIPLTVTFCTRM